MPFVLQENQRLEMEASREQIIQQNQNEKEDMIEKYEREKAELEQELAATQRDRDDSLMFAENEKQQVSQLNSDVVVLRRVIFGSLSFINMLFIVRTVDS